MYTFPGTLSPSVVPRKACFYSVAVEGAISPSTRKDSRFNMSGRVACRAIKSSIER